MCAGVCVKEREREREREHIYGPTNTDFYKDIRFLIFYGCERDINVVCIDTAIFYALMNIVHLVFFQTQMHKHIKIYNEICV